MGLPPVGLTFRSFSGRYLHSRAISTYLSRSSGAILGITSRGGGGGGAGVAEAAAEAEAGTLPTSRPAREWRVRSDVRAWPILPAASESPAPCLTGPRRQALSDPLHPATTAGRAKICNFQVWPTILFLPLPFLETLPGETGETFPRQNGAVRDSRHSLVSHADPVKHSPTRTSSVKIWVSLATATRLHFPRPCEDLA